jgi:plastocyanin
MPLIIKISVDPNGDFSYEYDPKNRRVATGDDVEFRCTAPGLQHFAVHVGWDTPLEKGRYREQGSSFAAKVREKARPGVYEFFVAALIESPRPKVEGDMAIYTDDPDFIVEN